MKEIQEKKMEAQEKAKKIIADASGVSPSLPVPGPKAIESEAKKNDSNTYFDYAMDILKGLATLSTGAILDVQSELNKAYALIVEGKYKEALKIYDAILSTDPYNTEAWLRKGICLFYLGRKNNSPEYHRQSIIIYDKVLQLEPTNKKALHMKGVASYYLGKIPLANEYYDKVLSIDPDFGPSLYNKACNLSRLGKKDESLIYLQKAISSDQKYKHWASKDNAFKDLQTDPEFKKMTRFDF
jgi:tetratricopeptide (TPR) repeat protein